MAHQDKRKVVGNKLNVKTGSHSSVNIPLGFGNEASSTQTSIVHMKPYDDRAEGLIKFGRYVMKILYGSTKHSLKTIAAGVFVGSLIVFTPVIDFYSKIYLLFKTQASVEPFLVVSILMIIFGWGFLGWAQQTKCPKCGSYFGYVRKSRKLVGRRKLPEKDIRNYEDSYECDFCGHKKSAVSEIEEI